MTIGRLGLLILAVMLAAFVAVTLWEGETPAWPSTRKDEPVFYWTIVAFLTAFVVALVALAFAI